MNLNPLAAEEQFLNPLDRVNGFDIRPGLYEINGANFLRKLRQLYNSFSECGFL